MMKWIFRLFLVVSVLAGGSCARERTLVLLSTNDMHATIDNFPKLATAVRQCRDTAQFVLLVDAGDRWTGNAFVDRAPVPGLPMIELMNGLKYDVGTLGNHDFDFGQAHLGQLLDSIRFPIVCANVVSDTTTFPQLRPDTVLDWGGKIRIGFVGVITNYDGKDYTPAGNAADFAGLTFPDPQQEAQKYGAELRSQCDLLVLISHMGDDRDREFLARDSSAYDLVIGGHTHKTIDTLINGTLLTQTGKNLENIGVTTIRMKGRKVVSIDFRNVPLAGYAPDPACQKEVDRYKADPALNRTAGRFAATADKWGVANWMARTAAEAVGAQIGFYHRGGVRLDSIGAGSVSRAMIYGLDPFGTKIVRLKMTPADMRRMIVSKYNDPVNVKEAHRIDLFSTTPYVIRTDAGDNAVDVIFPKLREGRLYTVAMPDYVFSTYHALNCTDVEITGKLITSKLFEDLGKTAAIVPDDTQYQEVLNVSLLQAAKK